MLRSSTRPLPLPPAPALAVAELPALALGLAVVLVGVKLVLLPFPVSSALEFARWGLRLALVVALDLAFVAGLWAVCRGGYWLLRHRCKLTQGWRAAVIAMFYLAGLYAVLGIPMYRITVEPFSIRLLSFMGGPTIMASSIAPYATVQLLAALLLAPLVVVCLPRILRRWTSQRTLAMPRLTLAGAFLLLTVYVSVSQAYIRQAWPEPHCWERRISQNPHLVLLRSCVTEACSSQPLTLTMMFDQTDESDFSAKRPLTPETIPVELAGVKNVIVVLLESIGAEYLGIYGGPPETTPNLARLAAGGGLVFDNYYVQVPNSCKSLVSLTQGIYPRVDWQLIVRDAPNYPVASLPRCLADRGFRTCYAHSGYWDWKQRDEYLRAQGVDTLIDGNSIDAPAINSWGVNDRAMFQSALDWVDAEPDRPFYLVAYTIETHHPYAVPQSPAEFDVDDEELARYLNSIRAADEHLAWLMEQLRERGLDESTLVVVTSDHGESFGQHQQREHMFGIYEPNVHIPLVLLHPQLAGRGVKHISEVRQQLDLTATLAQVLGVTPPAEWQGTGLFRPGEPRVYFFCVGSTVVLGLRDGRYKYHYHVERGYEELFDLEQDPTEAHNLASQMADRCKAYRLRVAGLATYQRELHALRMSAK